MSTAAAGFEIKREVDTERFARRLAPLLGPGQLLILTGSLGAGKTFFTRALCHALGLPEHERVQSPTFTLVHQYDTSPRMAHADVYRLETAAQVMELGLEELRDEGWLTVVEWGEPYLELLGGDALVISFSLDPRRLSLRATGAASERVQNALNGC
jgi:tRNA threonylcarbamoyladenosine biosynthesis protein TsaE